MPSRLRCLALLAAAIISCKSDNSSSPLSTGPNHLTLVSGSGQTGDVASALAAPLVVKALDGANNPVAGVSIAWSVTGGGTVAPATSTTGSDGTSSTTWTLGPTPGIQTVTATSTAISGASVSFLGGNGATLMGNVTLSSATPMGFSLSLGRTSRTARRTALASASLADPRQPRPTTGSIVVGFRSATLNVAAAGSAAYRSLASAQATRLAIHTRVASILGRQPVSDPEISPTILAARMRVTDTTQIQSVMAALRADPGVAWVEAEHVVSIHDGAPRPMPAELSDVQSVTGVRSATVTLPNDPNFYAQYWGHNMVDLPRAWSITTGSPNVIVAVVDMGIRFDHPDVSANLTADGYDFVSQWGYGAAQTVCSGGSFTTVDGDGDGPDADPTDPDDLEFDPFDNCWVRNTLGDHGLWTAGIIGSAGNDGSGDVGVNWSVRIRPVRVLGITGEGTSFDIAQGILYAAGLSALGANGQLVKAPSRAQIINMSLGGADADSTEGAAVAAAVAAGSLIVASAGNETTDFPDYPAGYPNVMAVSAVGQDGVIASYSNGGPNISVGAPGGEFRLDDNGGGGVLGPGYDFVRQRPTFLFGYGTSASAPFVSGIAALIFAQNPGLSAAAVRQRIEQYATRAAGTTRNDNVGWGIVDAYNSLTQQNGPTRQTFVRLIDGTSGATVKTATVASDGSFALTRLAAGSYLLQAGQDEAGDGAIGIPGRRFGWAGTVAAPTSFTFSGSQVFNAAVAIGMPVEVEPNDATSTANILSVGSYIVGQIATPDVQDAYKVLIPTSGQYTFETSGLVGSCGEGIELDTVLQLQNSSGTTLATNDNVVTTTGRFCSRITTNLTPGTYYAIVSGTSASGLASQGRYQLAVRAGP